MTDDDRAIAGLPAKANDHATIAGLPATDEDEVAIAAVLGCVERGEADVASGDLPRLAGYLGHPRKTLRLHAAGALSATLARSKVDLSFFDVLLASEDVHVRWGAAFAVGRAGAADSRVIDVAMEALGADDGDVRWAAASILVEAARPSAGIRAQLRALVAGGNARTRKMALLCLCDSGERDGALYRAALADADPFVRLAALTSLARGGDRSDESLSAISALADGDGDARVQRGAAAVLRRLTAS